MAQVVVIGWMRFPAENIEKLRPHLKALAEATQKHDGCITYDIAEDVSEPGLLRFSEIWPDAASLDRHRNAPHVVNDWRPNVQKYGMTERKFWSWFGEDAGLFK